MFADEVWKKYIEDQKPEEAGRQFQGCLSKSTRRVDQSGFQP